jgi:hypothetical protein
VDIRAVERVRVRFAHPGGNKKGEGKTAQLMDTAHGWF